MATELKVGQFLPLSIAFLDVDGNPMVETPKPDAPPSWANIPSNADSLTASPDGMTATVNALAVGVDTVRLQVSVNGQTYEATVDLSVVSSGPVQTLGSVQIVVGTPTP